MSVKMGRPKSDNPLSVVLKARIDVETNNRLSQYCSKHGCNITDVIRKGIEIVLEDESRGKLLWLKNLFKLYVSTCKA